MDLRNAGILPQHYMASQTKRPRLELLINQPITTDPVLFQEKIIFNNKIPR